MKSCLPRKTSEKNGVVERRAEKLRARAKEKIFLWGEDGPILFFPSIINWRELHSRGRN
jgi:hypothetical protein